MEGSPSRRMSQSIICDRAFEFGTRILNLADRMWNRGPSARHVASQLMRCGTSVGANAEEAQEGQSKADFIAKLSVSRKEARETKWLAPSRRSVGAVKDLKSPWELDESGQLLAMIRSAILTARQSASASLTHPSAHSLSLIPLPHDLHNCHRQCAPAAAPGLQKTRQRKERNAKLLWHADV